MEVAIWDIETTASLDIPPPSSAAYKKQFCVTLQRWVFSTDHQAREASPGIQEQTQKR